MSTLRNPARWLMEYFGGSRGNVRVTARTAIQTAPIWYGINKISGNIGTLPLNVMKELNPGAEKATKHDAYRLLRMRPNRYQTPFVFKQTMTKDAILWGNGRAYIYRMGKASELIPLCPDRTVTGLVEGEKWHCTMPHIDDQIRTCPDLYAAMMANPNQTVMIRDEDVLHIQGFGDGVCGLSLWQVAKTSLEVSLGGDERTAKQMLRGFAGKVMLEAPAESPIFRDKKQAEDFLKDFIEKHGAEGSADEIGLLRGGVKANVLQMSNRDAEFIAQRQFQRQEAALWLMLESILGDDTSVSYNSEEQKQLAYLKNCLSNWLTRWEEECGFKLLTKNEFESGKYYCKFNVAALLRTDTATTVDTLTKGIASRIWNPNEARIKLDEIPYEGGDSYENPAITPGHTVTEEEEEEDDDPPAAIVDRLEHLMGVEQKRVSRFIERGDSLEAIDQWYETWVETLGNAIENLGGDRIIAQRHCVNNLKYLKQNPPAFSLAGTAELLAKEIYNV